MLKEEACYHRCYFQRCGDARADRPATTDVDEVVREGNFWLRFTILLFYLLRTRVLEKTVSNFHVSKRPCIAASLTCV